MQRRWLRVANTHTLWALAGTESGIATSSGENSVGSMNACRSVSPSRPRLPPDRCRYRAVTGSGVIEGVRRRLGIAQALLHRTLVSGDPPTSVPVRYSLLYPICVRIVDTGETKQQWPSADALRQLPATPRNLCSLSSRNCPQEQLPASSSVIASTGIGAGAPTPQAGETSITRVRRDERRD